MICVPWVFGHIEPNWLRYFITFPDYNNLCSHTVYALNYRVISTLWLNTKQKVEINRAVETFIYVFLCNIFLCFSIVISFCFCLFHSSECIYVLMSWDKHWNIQVLVRTQHNDGDERRICHVLYLLLFNDVTMSQCCSWASCLLLQWSAFVWLFLLTTWYLV